MAEKYAENTSFISTPKRRQLFKSRYFGGPSQFKALFDISMVNFSNEELRTYLSMLYRQTSHSRWPHCSLCGFLFVCKQRGHSKKSRTADQHGISTFPSAIIYEKSSPISAGNKICNISFMNHRYPKVKIRRFHVFFLGVVLWEIWWSFGYVFFYTATRAFNYWWDCSIHKSFLFNLNNNYGHPIDKCASTRQKTFSLVRC